MMEWKVCFCFRRSVVPVVYHWQFGHGHHPRLELTALWGESIGGIESTLACPGKNLEHTAFFSVRRKELLWVFCSVSLSLSLSLSRLWFIPPAQTLRKTLARSPLARKTFRQRGLLSRSPLARETFRQHGLLWGLIPKLFPDHEQYKCYCLRWVPQPLPSSLHRFGHPTTGLFCTVQVADKPTAPIHV
jgi:hypothetical protein